MSVQMNVAEAKAKLSDLMARAERGERVELCRNGTPVLALIRIADMPPPKKNAFRLSYGAWAHLGPLTEEEDELLLAPDPSGAEGAPKEDWWP